MEEKGLPLPLGEWGYTMLSFLQDLTLPFPDSSTVPSRCLAFSGPSCKQLHPTLQLPDSEPWALMRLLLMLVLKSGGLQASEIPLPELRLTLWQQQQHHHPPPAACFFVGRRKHRPLAYINSPNKAYSLTHATWCWTILPKSWCLTGGTHLVRQYWTKESKLI